MKLKNLSFYLLALGVGLVSQATLAQALQKDVDEVSAVWRTDLSNTFTTQTPLLKMVPGGQAISLRMSGLNNEQYLDFGVLADEVVTEGKLQINFTASPSLIAKRSQLNIFLNGKLQKTIAFEAEMLGQLTRVEVPLDVQQIKPRNQLRLQFVGHYQELCESPTSETLWVDIDGSSHLNLIKQKVRLPNDLGQFPSPFVALNSQAPSVIPMVYAASPNSETKKASAILASYFGKDAAWRGIDFPVYFNRAPAEQHFVVFATNENRPSFLKDLPAVNQPKVSLMDAPQSQYAKMLVIQGRDEADLVRAVQTLTSGKQVLIGEELVVKDFKAEPLRQAYDAPNWVKEDQPILLSHLMQYPGQLTSRGYNPSPVKVGLRFAPDLFMIDSGSVSMDLKLRFSKPDVDDTAQLRVRLNDFLLASENLLARDGRSAHTLKLMKFYGPLATHRSDALGLAQNNELSFEVGYTRTISEGSADNCKSVVVLPQQIDIDPTSTLHVKGMYHYAQLPNLALFTQSGFPFTKYADLQETVVVIDEKAGEEKVTTLLNTVGRMGAATGAVATHISVTGRLDKVSVQNKDILLISELPMTLVDFRSDDAQDLRDSVIKMIDKGEFSDASLMQQREALFNPTGGLGAMVSLRSPFDDDRTVVTLMSEGDAGSFVLNEKIKSPASLTRLTGAVAIVEADREISFQEGPTYYVGNLPWYHQLWHTVGQYPLILVLCTLACAVLVGAGIFYFMRLWIRKRS